jgi:hypothetical protein
MEISSNTYRQTIGYLIILLLSIYAVILTGKTYVKLLNDITNNELITIEIYRRFLR